jgi:hypothetical protein
MAFGCAKVMTVLEAASDFCVLLTQVITTAQGCTVATTMKPLLCAIKLRFASYENLEVSEILRHFKILKYFGTGSKF